MAELDWRHQQILESLKKFSAESSAAIGEVASLKLRFIEDPDSQKQVYIGGREYQIVDAGINRVLHNGQTGSLRYERHESGPEIIGYIADLLAIVGGLYGFWEWLRPKIIESQRRSTETNIRAGTALKIEVRRVTEAGTITETVVELASMNQNLNTRKLERAIKAALKEKRE